MKIVKVKEIYEVDEEMKKMAEEMPKPFKTIMTAVMKDTAYAMSDKIYKITQNGAEVYTGELPQNMKVVEAMEWGYADGAYALDKLAAELKSGKSLMEVVCRLTAEMINTKNIYNKDIMNMLGEKTATATSVKLTDEEEKELYDKYSTELMSFSIEMANFMTKVGKMTLLKDDVLMDALDTNDLSFIDFCGKWEEMGQRGVEGMMVK